MRQKTKNIVIKTVNLTKKYGDFIAVKNLNLKVYEGEFFCLLGPNGAGKTTTFLMLLGLTRPTSGSAWVCGYNVITHPIEVRKRVGFVPEIPGLYDDLTARENLIFTADLNGIPKGVREKRIRELLEKVGLLRWADEKVSKFSRGMKQRLAIADALVKGPRVLILDEPTAGIDPAGSEEILSLLKTLTRDEGITVLMASHLLHHIEKYGDRIAIMNRGEVVMMGSVDSLAKEESVIELELAEVDEELTSKIRELRDVRSVELRGNRVVVVASEDVREELLKVVSERPRKVLGMKFKPSLERVYARCVEGV